MALATLLLVALASQAQTIKLSDLKIVSKAEITTTQAVRKYQSEGEVKVNIAEAAATLGYSAGDVTGALYMNQYDTETEAASGVLTNTYSTEGGWLLAEAYDTGKGEETGELVAVGNGNSKASAYIYDFECEGGNLYFTFGQFGGQLVAGKTYTAILYLVKGTDAAEVTVKVNTKDLSTLKLGDMTKLGEINFESDIYYSSSYAYKTISIDTDSLEKMLIDGTDGVDNSELVLYAMQSEDGTLTDNGQAKYGGFWIDTQSYSCGWGKGSVLFCEPEKAGDLNILHAGIYPDYGLRNTSVSGTVYIVGSGKSYYQLNVKLNVLPQPTVPQCETVDSINVVMEIVPDKSQDKTTAVALTQADYMKEAVDLNLEHITQLLGTDAPVFYCKSLNPTTGALLQYSNVHTTAFKSSAGFLMMDLTFFKNPAMTHVAAPFNPLPQLTKAYGIGYDDGKLSFWQQPSDREVGDYYQNDFYLVNIDQAKKIAVNVTVVFVEERNPQVDIVANESVTLSRNNAKGSYAQDMNIKHIAALIGAEENTDLIEWKAYNTLGQLLATNYDETTGFSLDKDGRIADDDSTYVFSAGYIDGAFHAVVDKDTESELKTVLVASFNGKGCKFTLTLSDKRIPDVNNDGMVDDQDVNVLYDYIKNYSDKEVNADLDVNEDGVVDTQDVIAAYQYIWYQNSVDAEK